MKKFLAIVFVLAVVATVGLLTFFLTLDVNQYKAQITSAVEAATGRSFTIEGDIGMKISLVPTVSVSGVTLGNSSWGADDYLASVGRFEARAALLPLLAREIVIKQVILHDARLNLESNADGLGNWNINTAASETESTGTLPKAVVESVSLRNVSINYRQPTRAQPLQISLNSIDVETTGMEAPLTIAIAASLDGLPVQLAGKIGAITTLLEDQDYLIELDGSLGALKLSLNGSIGQPLSAAGVKLALEASAADLARVGEMAALELPAVSPVSVQAGINDASGIIAISDLQARLGGSDISGLISLKALKPRPRLEADLISSRLDLTELLPQQESADPAKNERERLFSKEPLPLEALRLIDADVHLNIATLISSALTAEAVSTQINLADGKLTTPQLSARAADGKLHAELMVDASASPPLFNNDLTVEGLNLSKVPAIAEKNLIHDGVTDLAVKLKGTGKSLAEMMASASGKLLVKVGPATLTNTAVQAGSMDLLLNTLRLLNPLSSNSESTQLECAVINLPVTAGIAQNDNGIALLTSQLSVLGGGSINLGTEAIDIGAQPKPREGIGLNVAGLSEFMRIGGTLSEPRAVTDAKGAAVGAVKLGAAVATGGLSLLAEGLLDRSTADEDVCGIALGLKSATKAGSSQTEAKDNTVVESASDKATQGVEAASDGVKRVFKGLFGN